MTARKKANRFDIYHEPDDPSPDTFSVWESVAPGLHASVGSIDVLYARSSVPKVDQSRKWSGSAWKGEKVSAQLVLWSREPIKRMRFEFTDFNEVKGGVLPAGIACARFVRYVLTDEFGDGDGCADRKPEDHPVFLSPDALDHVSSFDKEAYRTRPVWVTIEVPSDAAPGIYTGSLHLHAEGQKAITFELEVEVQAWTLPPPSEWKFHLDLWQHPYAVARMHEVELWSEEHWEVMRPLMKMLADAGQKVITTTITDQPWGSQTLDPYESMVVWNKKEDSSWVFDYTVFDNWVEFMMEMGVTKQINAYSLLPWTSVLTYIDEASGEVVSVKVEPGSEEYVDLWTPFIIDFRAHLEEKGWNNITNLAMDEIKTDKMQLMLAVMEKHAPEFGIASADSERAYKKFPDRVQDLSVAYAVIIDEPDLLYRKSKGYLSTYYVCCREPYPNAFTFSPPAESTYLGWYAVAGGFDGFLRWNFTHWVEDPLHDSRFRKWPAGDTYFVYPDARSSIRFERLVEGIQDAEKVRIIREELTAVGTSESRAKLDQLENMLGMFSATVDQDKIIGLVNHGKKVLKQLSR